MDQVLKNIVTSIVFDEVLNHVTMCFDPAGKFPMVMKLLNSYEPNNTVTFEIIPRGPHHDSARLTIKYRTRTSATRLRSDYKTSRTEDRMTVEQRVEAPTDSDSSDTDNDDINSDDNVNDNGYPLQYNPQNNVELLKMNLTDAYTITAIYRGDAVDAEALFRQYGPCHTEHYMSTTDDTKAISTRYQLDRHARKIINLYRQYIQRTDEDVQGLRRQEREQGPPTTDYVRADDTICVRVPRTVSKQELTEIFATFGEIADIRRIKPNDEDERYTAFIQYRHKDSAYKAVTETDNTYLPKWAYNRRQRTTKPATTQENAQERQRTVGPQEPAQRQRRWTLDPANNTKLYVLAPPDTTQQEFRADFIKYEEAIQIELTNGKKENNEKVGYVIYKDKIDAIDAKLNGPRKYKIDWK
ncbi:uncharacterized protein LOC100499182 isoform X1 [Nasonia vitripennis]|uniref:RRM domain-containing protein n=1 Tax=Nasonia vitripennis TaxID=7425 RepID=A0A7M7R5S6_NASVI|nr:uncharacterized protein LOC100499182 isoform X1 [Nasonia vitripennis]XP_031785961.1 uncharacterized protein LOC100499182 isoform X1 [Nasonia vitripennis]XP_031785962.1 uncharacterized protein LOC100499182 isoform X1 [Nasonia vitripennis]XP_031785964.1 uncharacterized protein LOC100499182 isoform X1 [Nasonia vitripennis]XP_031785965.1 uncharacterized protein LOC100499182 isoform X1 [Nasonia vitripennis]XP_031785966.1 uncharacterized protein LOC100499182 isoform X1 [Nasonia vitripennis]XP_03